VADKTGISWTNATWNPVTGCDKVSPGCGLPRFDGDDTGGCYAMALAKRLKAMGSAKYQNDGKPPLSGPGFGVTLHPHALEIPYHWRDPRRIFVTSMGDLFHDQVPDGFIAQVWDVIGRNQQHVYQVLTKRHARMRSWMRRWADTTGDRLGDEGSGMPPMPRGPQAFRASSYSSGRSGLFADMLDSMGDPPEGCAYPLYDWMEGWRFWPSDLFNVWLGVSAEDQHWADIRISALLDTPAAVRFASLEPLLGPVDLHFCGGVDALERDWTGGPGGGSGAPHPFLDWVIVGGESGPGHRPMEIEWLESIVSQCQDAGVPVHVKQDSGPRSGMQGRIPDDIWKLKQFPSAAEVVTA
jgi:protein gp37